MSMMSQWSDNLGFPYGLNAAIRILNEDMLTSLPFQSGDWGVIPVVTRRYVSSIS